MKGRNFELNEGTLSIIEEIGGHMPGGFFIYRADEPEELIYANKAVFDIYGCSSLEEFKSLTGYTFRGMVHPDDYDRISSSIIHQIAASDEQMDYAEYRIIRRDGAVRWVDDYGHLAETKAYGRVYVVFISDITDKKTSTGNRHSHKRRGDFYADHSLQHGVPDQRCGHRRDVAVSFGHGSGA